METLKPHRLFGVENPIGKLAVAAALLAGIAAPAQAQENPIGPIEPHVIPMTEDGNPSKSLDLDRDEAMAKVAQDQDMQYMRIKVMPRDIMRKNPKYEMYDNRVKTAQAHGQKIYMTLSLRGVSLNPDRVEKYATDVVTHYKDLGVDWYSIGNEPNSPYEMQRLGRYTMPETYHIYYETSYNAIKSVMKTAKINIGELNGWHMRGGIPSKRFFKEMLECPRDQPACPPLKADGYAHHPYDFTKDPRSDVCTEEVAGINCIDQVNKWLERAHKTGRLTTTTGAMVKLDLPEFAYLVKVPELKTNTDLNSASPRYRPDSQRQTWLRVAANRACSLQNVRLLNFYGQLPPPLQWPGPFYANTLKRDGTKYGSYFVIRNFIEKRTDCVMKPETSSATGGVSSVKINY